LDGGYAFGAPQQCVESGNVAELLIAHDGELFFGAGLRGLTFLGQSFPDQAGPGAALVEKQEQGEGCQRNQNAYQSGNQKCGHIRSQTSVLVSNSAGRKRAPAAARRSVNFGRMPV